ncbi:hypothetical protein [Arthrobacter bambusae]|uniref:Uncharacterized protein n=1 Tax=Arthrobacter bambusae TaxID=1338426 RepID=A0AAW8DGK8_9MICC|nr:hypothetical protein [Arthrobacter bambusae]MDP9904802.1 hypothetical protein [Arthrobacter bambusae]MDQ0129618.1 hypothetical protein [Arthrobacter bambusae]MDQ0180769.1 hypothetical protein [Arthrobacter bambusae]
MFNHFVPCMHRENVFVMSYDVFLQGFVNGEPVLGGGVQMREVLAPFIVREEPDSRCLLIEYGDGTADVYLADDGMMANHISGEQPWELVVKGAAGAGWVIMPVGCPTCLTEEAQRADLPESIREDAVVTATGADLLRAIRSS